MSDHRCRRPGTRRKSKGTLTSPLGALRSSERPFTQVPTRRRHSSGPPGFRAHRHTPSPHRHWNRPLARRPFDVAQSTSGLQEETFYDFALPVLRRSASPTRSLALQAEETHGTRAAQTTPQAFGVVQVG